MVKHHHDSSQLVAALFGPCDSPDQEDEPCQKTKNSGQSLKNEEDSSMNQEDFWNKVQCNPNVMNHSQQPSMAQESFFSNKTNNPSQMMANDMQHVMSMQAVPQSAMSQTVMNPFLLPTASPSFQQYLPVQMPSYGNGPVYVIMAPQGAMPQIMPGMVQNYPRSIPETRETVLQTASSDSSYISGLSMPPNSNLGSGQSVRSKWGDKGVGIGHFWNPEDPTHNGKGIIEEQTSPTWANKEENILPGLANSKQGEKIHNRGSAVVLDSQQLSEKQRRHKQALENQRIIQMQLEEKKKIREEKEEKERIETELMEKTLKEQQEKEKKEFEEEQNKKKEKEEAEEKRQARLRQAIIDATEKAKKEKQKVRLAKLKGKISLQTSSDSTNDNTDKEAFMIENNIKKSVIVKSPRKNENELDREAEDHLRQEKDKTQIEHHPQKIILPDLVQTSQLSLMSRPEKVEILRALGVAPDYLMSSGIFERASFKSVLSYSMQYPSPATTPLLKEDAGDYYIRNRIVTPTKFRNAVAKDCSTQCNESDRPSRRREIRRHKKIGTSYRGTPGSSPESRPPWGKHQSHRPYRKQSEKDPQAVKKVKKRSSHKSVSISDHGSIEESDCQMMHVHSYQQRRRRKTWDMSRYESHSSDFSRSPSPRIKPVVNLPRGPPPIRSPLIPHMSRESSLAHAIMQSNQITLTPPKTEETTSRIHTPTSPIMSPKKDDDEDVAVSVESPFRSDSPPVPALMKKMSGVSNFNVPEYPPGVQPLSRQTSGVKKSFPTTLETKEFKENEHHDPSTEKEQLIQKEIIPEFPIQDNITSQTPSQNKNNLESSTTSVSNSTKHSESPGHNFKVSSLPTIEGAVECEESKNSPENMKLTRSLKRMSLTGAPRADLDQQNMHSFSSSSPKTSSSLPSSPSRPPTPRRLPPMSPTSPSASLKEVKPNSSSILLKSNVNAISANTFETHSARFNQGQGITPVEISPRVSATLESNPTVTSPIIEKVKKKDSSDSGILSGEGSRPGSPESANEDILAISVPSSGYSSYRKISDENRNLMTDPMVTPEKWDMLKNISSIRQNLWKPEELQTNKDLDSVF